MKAVQCVLPIIIAFILTFFSPTFVFSQDTESLIVTEQGRVGVGVTNPLGKLHVPGANETPAIYLTGEDNIWFDSGQIRITTHDGYGNWQIKTGADNNDKYCGACNGAIKLRMDENGNFRLESAGSGTNGSTIPWNLGLFQNRFGNVGINTTSPSAMLHVKGDATTVAGSKAGGLIVQNLMTDWSTPMKANFFGGYYGVSYLELMVNDNGYFLFREDGIFSESSDERIKEDIEELGDSLDQIKKLRSVKYHTKMKKPDKDQKYQFGFIAQEVEEIYPELVLTGADGYKSIAYTRLLPPIVEAVKELSTEIDTLKEQTSSMDIVEELQIAVEELKSDNEALKAVSDELKVENEAIQKTLDEVLDRLAKLEEKS